MTKAGCGTFRTNHNYVIPTRCSGWKLMRCASAIFLDELAPEKHAESKCQILYPNQVRDDWTEYK
ncbi:Protein of unknown function [Pyronema omphalodes CBS 100304]|uniref:Uncharacterized protein n=1 Tax=Pyronema omphalodes (strain CBS 100304) TaxID=1076935 RepID=U4LNW1_PYROM|nr:Protein of unknown function [Pyronema omphalodes CBS 100304]